MHILTYIILGVSGIVLLIYFCFCWWKKDFKSSVDFLDIVIIVLSGNGTAAGLRLAYLGISPPELLKNVVLSADNVYLVIGGGAVIYASINSILKIFNEGKIQPQTGEG